MLYCNLLYLRQIVIEKIHATLAVVFRVDDTKIGICRGSYNLILTGSAFMDASLHFPKYNSENNAANRALVDEMFNCEDVLMNFIAASSSAPGEYLQFVRPTMRIDLSFTEGAGQSTCQHAIGSSGKHLAGMIRIVILSSVHTQLTFVSLVSVVSGKRHCIC